MFSMAENIASLLRQFRLRLRMTQAEIADKLGASRQQYANWEYGRSQPTGVYLTRLESLGSRPTGPPMTTFRPASGRRVGNCAYWSTSWPIAQWKTICGPTRRWSWSAFWT